VNASPAILKKHIVEQLSARKELEYLNVEICNNPRFHTDAIRIMRDNTEVMRITVDGPNVHFQRTVPRYEGDPKKVSAADIRFIDKIINELYISNQDPPSPSP
jgi:hypothetical protein